MYFHDTNKPNGHASADSNCHHYNNENLNNGQHVNHYCNDALLSGSRMSQRQSATQAYIQKSALDRKRMHSGTGYEGAVDSCNTEASLLPDYGT